MRLLIYAGWVYIRKSLSECHNISCYMLSINHSSSHQTTLDRCVHKPPQACTSSTTVQRSDWPAAAIFFSNENVATRADVIEIYETYDWVIWCCSWAACCDWLVDNSVGNAARGFTAQLTNKIMIKDSALQMNWQSLARISVTDRDVDRQTDRQTGLQQHSVIHLDQQPTSILVVCVQLIPYSHDRLWYNQSRLILTTQAWIRTLYYTSASVWL